MERFEGRLDEAAPLYEEALALVGRESDDPGIATYQCKLAAIDIEIGQLGKARDRLLESTEIVERAQIGGFAGQASIELTSALAGAGGDVASAARLAGASEALLETMGAQREPADEHFIRPLVNRIRESLGQKAFDAAFAAGQSLDSNHALAEARAWLAAAPPRRG